MDSKHSKQTVLYCPKRVIEIIVKYAANNVEQKAAELKAEYISKRDVIRLNLLVHKYATQHRTHPKFGYMNDYVKKTNYLALCLEIKKMIFKSNKLIEIVPKQLSQILQNSVSLAIKIKVDCYRDTIEGLKIKCNEYGETINLSQDEVFDIVSRVHGSEGPDTRIFNNANAFELKHTN